MDFSIEKTIIQRIKSYFLPLDDINFKYLLDFLVDIYDSMVKFSQIIFGALHKPADEVLFPVLEIFENWVPNALIEWLSTFSVSDVLFGSGIGVIVFGVFYKWVREFLPW